MSASGKAVARIADSVPCSLAIAFALGLIAPDANGQGGGPSLYEVGTPDMGLSSAGAGARSRDAATAYTNPAGMTQLTGRHVLFGAYELWVVQEFEADPGGTVSVPPGSLDGGGRSVTPQAAVGTYAVVQIDERRWFGFALNAPFAGGSDYDESWIGRAFVTESQLVGLNMEPSFAVRLDPRWSLGVGLNVFFARLESKRLASNAAGAPRVTLEADDVGVGATVAALYTPNARTRIGLTYRSEIDVELEGELDSPGEPNATLDFTLPRGVSLSLRRDVTPRTSLLADVGWTDWSAFSKQRSSVAGVPSVLDRGWNDTWRVGLGVEWLADERWLLQAGIGFDSSAIDDNRLLPDIPFQESLRYSVGCQYRLDERWALGMTYTFMDRGTPDVDRVALPPSGAVVLDGEFRESVRHFLGFTLSWSG